MNNTIRLADGLTFSDLNPLNFSLKNDYICNLFSTGLLLLPKINACFKFKIIRGFVSKSYIYETVTAEPMSEKSADKIELLEYNERVKSLLYKHGEGLAIEIGLVGFKNTIEAMAEIVREIILDSKEKISAILMPDSNAISFFRGVKGTEIKICGKDFSRIVFKD